MNKRKKYIFLVMFIIVIPTIFGGIGNVNNISAKSKQEVEKEIKELENETKDLSGKKGKIDTEKKSIESEMSENLNEQESVQVELDEISSKLAKTEANIKAKEIEINELKKEVKKFKKEIKQLNNEIEELKEKIQVRSELLKDRLRSIQENGGLVQYLSVILGSESFADLITRSSTVNLIMDQDKNIIESLAADELALKEKQLAVKTKKTAIEDKKKDQEKQKTTLLSMKVTLDEQKSKQDKIKSKLGKAYEELENYSFTLEEEAEIIAAQDAALKKAKSLASDELSEINKKEEAAKASEQNNANNSESNTPSNNGSSGGGNVTTGGNGMFILPTNGGRFSSPFGPRVHPVTGERGKMHTGLDIAIGSGNPVYAGATGVVTRIVTGCTVGNYSCGSGYGNHIIVSHHIGGQDYATLYAHLSSVDISSGQVVEQGQTIGKVGSTGSSTGPHLHFEVHPGGYKNPADPKRYLP